MLHSIKRLIYFEHSKLFAQHVLTKWIMYNYYCLCKILLEFITQRSIFQNADVTDHFIEKFPLLYYIIVKIFQHAGITQAQQNDNTKNNSFCSKNNPCPPLIFPFVGKLRGPNVHKLYTIPKFQRSCPCKVITIVQ